uniref:Uncharacterized protein n=1 Tax=Arion vulgaris TaxID=1028688 RepID=A0A0B6Y6M4_9EUPU
MSRSRFESTTFREHGKVLNRRPLQQLCLRELLAPSVTMISWWLEDVTLHCAQLSSCIKRNDSLCNEAKWKPTIPTFLTTCLIN